MARFYIMIRTGQPLRSKTIPAILAGECGAPGWGVERGMMGSGGGRGAKMRLQPPPVRHSLGGQFVIVGGRRSFRSIHEFNKIVFPA